MFSEILSIHRIKDKGFNPDSETRAWTRMVLALQLKLRQIFRLKA
jgi:hypothetical protein